MKKYMVEFDITEIVKLISVCNAAIVSEEETLRNLSGVNQRIIDNTKVSVEKIWELKTKLKNTIVKENKDVVECYGI